MQIEPLYSTLEEIRKRQTERCGSKRMDERSVKKIQHADTSSMNFKLTLGRSLRAEAEALGVSSRKVLSFYECCSILAENII